MAATTALGPGTGTTGTECRIAASTSASPGALTPGVPASVTKIVTAWLAMQTLGGDYRFLDR